MPKITSVEPQKKNPHRFNIYLDGQFAFGADEDLVVDRRLVVGKKITHPECDKLLFEAEVGKLMERMYALFSRRQRSEKETKDYLKNLSFKRKVKGKEEISDLTIDATINKLKQKGLINDEEFARAWVDARRKSKRKGNIALKQELYKKGIDREIIEQVMSDEPPKASLDRVGLGVMSQSEGEIARQALEKKMRLWRNLSALELKKKAYEFLMRRGFEYEVVKETVEKLLKKT